MYLKYAECTIHVCSYMPSPAYDSGYALDQTFSTLREVTHLAKQWIVLVGHLRLTISLTTKIQYLHCTIS